MLDADPLADIKNIRKLNTIVRDGKIIDGTALPSHADLVQAVVDDEARKSGHERPGAPSTPTHD